MVPLPALLDGGGHSDHQAPVEGEDPGPWQRTAHGGAEIVALLKTGRPTMRRRLSARRDVEANPEGQTKKILPCAALPRRQYGVNGLYVGVPVKLGRCGRRAGHRDHDDARNEPPPGGLQEIGRCVRELVDKLKL